ncbi:hypothetical protein [Frankia sp. Cas3]|uniref:hypothetical protein n=1 Tax=Frankia sp. Cas3 TaxID=3073926 RepID=UPI002AD534EC|nr:hypothetical protein [Frankia sp. Cas3]
MSLGLTPGPGLFRSTADFYDTRVAPGSIYAVLHREGSRLFPDVMFADLFADVGRRWAISLITRNTVAVGQIGDGEDVRAAVAVEGQGAHGGGTPLSAAGQ